MAYACNMYMPFSLRLIKGGRNMVEMFIYILLFMIGIYFGSFFTLATYRIPKKENITYKHSYCPSCNHKLGILELVPLFSYILLAGKCKHCKQKIGIRYFLLELLGGITFVLFGASLHFIVPEIDSNKIAYLILGILYFSSLFILGGIDKENHTIQKSVLIYGIIVSIGYMIYSYTLQPDNVYAYMIYLCMMIALLFMDTILLRRKLQYSYTIQLLILVLYMLIFSGAYAMFFTIGLTILAIGFENILRSIRNHKNVKKVSKKEKTPVAFYLAIANIIVIIMSNYMSHYLV